MMLTDVEVRVLGCLVEKELTTPQQYPLSELAVVTACNQTTNRDPVVTYEQGTVRGALIELRRQGLAKLVQRVTDRASKHRHLLDETLGLAGDELAVLCVLLLRGPQTPGELRARTERMHAFADTAAVDAVVDRLAGRDEPLVARLPRQAGRKEARVAHRLGGDTLLDAEADADAAGDGQEAPVGRPRTLDALVADLAALRAEVEDLRRAVTALQSPPEGASGGER